MMRVPFLVIAFVSSALAGEVLLPETVKWRSAAELPPENWQEPGFNDSEWPLSLGAGAKDETSQPWKSGRRWLRTSFQLAEVPRQPQFILRHRGEVTIRLNGHLVADLIGETSGPVPMPIEGEAFSSMKKGANLITVELDCVGNDPSFSLLLENVAPAGNISAPLYRDPRFDGAADAMAVWDRGRERWTMFYTQRRANLKHLPGVGYCYGCDVGMAVSTDGGRTWKYDGIAEGLETQGGRNTWWAPEVVFIDGLYHMWVSRTEGVRTSWGGDPTLVHYTSGDLKHWTYSDAPPFKDVIDAAIFPLPSGGWRMFYKQNSKTVMADSRDLKNWKERGIAAQDAGQEGPNVFRWKGRYWMIADVWRGQQIYQSDDLTTWKLQEGGTILGKPGSRRDDGAFGRHADVIVQGERAFILYFTHPGGDDHHDKATSLKRTSVQVAELKLENGRITCDRNQPLDYEWKPELLNW